MSKVFDAYAAYYDLLYKDKDYSAETDFVRRLLCRNGIDKGRILELGCGTGRHAELLARNGYEIHGIDLSDAMIKMASSRVTDELSDRLFFEVGDARTAKIPGKEFDAVLSLFHVASYQTRNEDFMSFIQTAALNIVPGGILIFDFWYGPAVLTERPTVRIKRLCENDCSILRIAEPVMRENEDVVDVSYTILISKDGSEKRSKIEELHSMRYFFAPEIQFFLQAAGFTHLEIIEWLTGNQVGFNSWSAVAIARK